MKGIGPKTAKRVILDLKDKVSKLGNEKMPDLVPENSVREEAISALLSLGFNKQQIVKKIDIVMGNMPSDSKVEILIKEVLKQLS